MKKKLNNKINTNSRIVFITGMIRSGSTLLSNILNLHSDVISISDPYFDLFKTFRNEVARKKLKKFKINYNSEISDYYFDKKQNKLMDIIQKENLNLSTKKVDLKKLIKKLKANSYNSKPICNNLNSLKGKNFKELFLNAFKILFEVYGNKKTKIICFKQGWTDEFGLHI